MQAQEVVRQYCDLIEDAASYTAINRIEFLSNVGSLLALLVVRFGGVVKASRSDDLHAKVHDRQSATFEAFQSLLRVIDRDVQYYRVFDPYGSPDSSDGDLALDLSEIYGDLVVHRDVPMSDEAFDALVARYWNHWGRHAIFALVAIHHLLRDEVAL